MLGLGVGGSLDGGSEEVVGVVSCKIFFGYLGMDHNLADLCFDVCSAGLSQHSVLIF